MIATVLIALFSGHLGFLFGKIVQLIQKKNICNKEDTKHIEWIYNRLLYVYKENENYDYMIKLKNIIEQFKKK
jgi:hypothetical protein